MKNRLNYLKIFEDFEEKSIPNIIKKISYKIRKDIQLNGDNSFNNEYNIDGLNLHIKIIYNKGIKQPYYSNVNIYDIISGIEPIEIKVIVTDNKIDINYLMSIISHEIRHVYDIFTIKNDVEIEDFKKSMIISKYKNQNSFISLVYLSLEHELIARHNMLYELFRWINITDKNQLYDIFKTTYTYTALQQLNNFNAEQFINNQNLLQLTNFTINFSKDIKDNYIDIYSYYKKWELFFKKKSNEFMEYVDNMLDNVINDIENNKIYERLNGFISYNEDISNNVSYKLFNKIINEKNSI